MRGVHPDPGESKTPSIGQIEATLLQMDVHLARNENGQARQLRDEASAILRPGDNVESELSKAVNERLARLTSDE